MIRCIAIGVVAAIIATITSRFMNGFFSELLVAAIVGALVGIGGTVMMRASKPHGKLDD